MRWLLLFLLCALVIASFADPEPKKYKHVSKKDKESNTTLTEDERKFLRDVETKFGIKSDVKSEDHKNNTIKLPFPAVIAIEIVNDTDADGKPKGKRTIDANLGYGYRTNNGYSYSYFGKPKGKFMIYPYSQEDIPPAQPNSHFSGFTHTKTEVDIKPSQAYELVPVKEQEYDYSKTSTKYNNKYENVKSVESPPPAQPLSTLYTTYNGQQFSGLSGQFPSVMPNFLVEPSQLLQDPTYQSAGLTQDYLQSHGQHLEQRVVPVLVLRVPSSYLKSPTAELYSDFPSDYPLSKYLKSVNLQELVNEYFNKIGFSMTPQVTAYHGSTPVSSTDMHHYATPQLNPSYTQADYAGVQYSAVQPVMAKYPSNYPRQQHHVAQSYQMVYHNPSQQQYEYQYESVPQNDDQTQVYYESQQQEPKNTLASVEQEASKAYPNHETPQEATYESSQTYSGSHAHASSPYSQMQQLYSETYQRLPTKPEKHYSTFKPMQPYSSHTVQKESSSSYPSQYGATLQKQTAYPDSGISQSYLHQTQVSENSASDTFVISENYPSKDHTIATVLPKSYKPRKPVQTVSYVTPVPSAKYQSMYKVMVPQTVLTSPNSGKISYVNSQSMPSSSYQQLAQSSDFVNGEYSMPYSTSLQYSASRNSASHSRAPSYPKHYRNHPKRMAKPHRNAQSTKQTELIDQIKSS